MKFRCQPVDLGFLERATHRIVNVVELDASAERVFELFTDGPAWAAWFEEIQEVVWTSPRPHGVGTTRTVRLTTMSVYERFLAWEPGRRFSFCFTAASLPTFRSLVEDYRLEPLGADRCRLTWTACYEPRVLLRLVHPVASRQLSAMFSRAAAGLASYVSGLEERNPA